MQNVIKRPNGKTGIIGRLHRTDDLHHLELRFGELIDAAAINPWLQVAEELRRVTPGVRVVIQAHDPSFGRPLVALAVGWSDGYLEKYSSHLARPNEVAKRWSNTAPLLKPVLLPELVLPICTFLKSDFYNEGLRFEGEADCATGIRVFNEGERHATLAVQYGLRHKETMHERLSPLLQLLGPKLRGAISANRHTIRRKMPLLKTDLLHTLLDPAFIVDQHCRVISANQSAQDLLTSSETLRIGVRDVFSFGTRQIDVQFKKLVHASCERAPGSSGYLEFNFIHQGSQFYASILPVTRSLEFSEPALAALFAPKPVVLLVLRSDDFKRKVHEFQSHFGLTAAELRIVQALSQEGSLVQIAERLVEHFHGSNLITRPF